MDHEAWQRFVGTQVLGSSKNERNVNATTKPNSNSRKATGFLFRRQIVFRIQLDQKLEMLQKTYGILHFETYQSFPDNQAQRLDPLRVSPVPAIKPQAPNPRGLSLKSLLSLLQYLEKTKKSKNY
ncbi:hypothetical protein RIR_jg41157.t1 [Rhizophagus irregularis DAOM 181602=DAOM 197198]|uniref:Uncharacterized protein n=1 Tax=Rhizophagus irregularis (strain DAOM 181602 / DAOM 197198 / MUCL 43194) TaxID=747089 RepID=U9SUI8_RHIID|nr:hypothetical protein RIR_jg41157.t1 [Rhizophagus irregularis DAOM 181602=DAOM 197198]